MSRQGKSIETRTVEALERQAMALESMAATNRAHFELAAKATARSMSAHEKNQRVQEESIARSVELHDALMERHAQVSESHELWMSAVGARAPDTLPEDIER
jgi:hypothetical protein